MIVDAQIHAWKESARYPTPEHVRPVHGDDFPIERALAAMNEHGVERAILVPPASWLTGRTRNSYCMAAARRFPDRFATMGVFDFDARDAKRRLAGWRRPGMLGVRVWFAPGAPAGPLTDAKYDWFWERLQADDLPFMSAAPGRMHLFIALMRQYPGLRLIIDHAARDPRGRRGPAAWTDLDDTLALAAWPSTSIKVTCLPSASAQAYPFADLHHPIRRIHAAFGARRMLWGSDVTRLPSPYGDNLRLFTKAIDFLTAEDRQWILGRSALRATRWMS